MNEYNENLKEFIVVRVSRILAKDINHAKAKAIGGNYWPGDDEWIVLPKNDTTTT